MQQMGQLANYAFFTLKIIDILTHLKEEVLRLKMTKLKIKTYDELAYQFNDPAREFRDGCINIMQTCNENPEANKKLLQPEGLKCLENIKLILKNYQLTEKTLIEQNKRDD